MNLKEDHEDETITPVDQECPSKNIVDYDSMNTHESRLQMLKDLN